MHQLTEEKKNLVLDAIVRHPNNMSEAARYAKLPFGTFAARAKSLGVYAPNPTHRFDQLSNITKTKHWNLASKVERRRRVLSEQNDSCLFCNITEWNGNPIVLELDHIDGNGSNNDRDNIRALCPNCHSQTPTFRNKRRNNRTTVSDDQLIQALKQTQNIRQALILVNLVPKAGNYNRAKKLFQIMLS